MLEHRGIPLIDDNFPAYLNKLYILSKPLWKTKMQNPIQPCTKQDDYISMLQCPNKENQIRKNYDLI